jgi:uncharacterized membrane protein HdeD (DUF308 family)
MSTLSSTLTRKDAALRGVLAFALGLVFVIWPGVSIGTAVALFAIFCFVDAAVALSRLFSSERSAGDRILNVLRTVVDVTAAVVAIAYPGPTAEVLTVIIGVYAIVVGALELSASGGALAKAARSSGLLRVAGVLSIIAGALLIVWPNIGVVTLAVVFGAYLAAYGALLLVSAAMAPKDGTVPNPAG